MSDYTPITDFSAKDGLTSGDPEKIIAGADVDAELDAIQTAVNSKYDSDEIATEAEAEALTLDTKIITPLQLDNVFKDNAGMLSDIQALADPGEDTLLGWDDSAGAVIGFTIETGLVHSGTALSVDHDAATNFVANEHVDHSGVTLTAGDGLTGGGTIAASRTFDVGAGDGITANANDVAVDSTVLRTTGAQSISGVKTFTTGIQFNDGDYIHMGTGDDLILSATGTTGTIEGVTRLNVIGDIVSIGESGELLGFYGSAGTVKPTITGSTVTAAMNSLLTQFHNMGILTDSTTF